MAEIKVESSKRQDAEGNKGVVIVQAPDVLTSATLDDLVAILGPEMVFKKASSQVLIDFRSFIRSQMESTEDDEFRNELSDIEAGDYSDWVPTVRVRKTSAEKAKEQLGKMDPEAAKALLKELGLI